MSIWIWIATPLLVLPILSLFRFVGCSSFTEAPAVNVRPRYRDYILGVANPGQVKNPNVPVDAGAVIAYWRLVDAPTSVVAADEKGVRPGAYVTVPGGIARPPPSQNAPGNFVISQPGLIDSDPGAMGRLFLGGYVMVPWDAANPLWTDEFTIEAWVKPNWGADAVTNFEHVLFAAGGHYRAPFDSTAAYHGFRVYVDTNGKLQVFINPHTTPVISAPPLMPLGKRFHLAVTVQFQSGPGSDLKITLYLDGQPSDGAAGAYSRPDGAPLQIGCWNEQSDPGLPVQPTEPFLATIQEVVLHRKALSSDEIANIVSVNTPVEVTP